MEIRKLTESDYDMVVELYKELDEFHVKARPDYFVHREKQEIYPKDAFVHNLSHPGVLQLGAFENEQLVGVVRASLWEESGMVKDVNTVCLDTIYVLPAYRRKGIAKRLFADVESWAKEQGAVRLDLHTWDFNKNAIAMYRAFGDALFDTRDKMESIDFLYYHTMHPAARFGCSLGASFSNINFARKWELVFLLPGRNSSCCIC